MMYTKLGGLLIVLLSAYIYYQYLKRCHDNQTQQFLVKDKVYYEYKYMQEREELQEKEETFGNRKAKLTEDEKIVSSYLKHLKRKEYERTEGMFLPSRPVQDVLIEIKASEIYPILKKFPKGGNMHLHHEHMVSKGTILDIVIDSPLYDNLYVKREDPYWKLDLFINPPEGWEHVKTNQPMFSKANIIKHVTFINILKSQNSTCPETDPDRLWKLMEPMFWLLSDTLTNHVDVCGLHMEAMMQAALDENVQYLESRTLSYDKVYELDKGGKYVDSNGKHILDTTYGEKELEIIERKVQDFRHKNPNFIGYKRIVNSIRGFNKDMILQDMEKAYFLYRKFPNLVVGFDMVAEEDNGYSYLYFLDNFASFLSQNKSLPFYLHTGETVWPGDIMTTHFDDDLVGAEENLLDSLVFGVKRIGHGLSLFKHPYLMNVLKERDIAVEVNPVSNMILGYVHDQRTHPAITLLRHGVPIVLGADDPGTFGYDEFTVDWYLVFMAWGLDLVDLKQLARNSLKYSAMSESEKVIAFQKWESAWDIFISDMKSKACNQKSVAYEDPIINKVLPQGGPSNGGNKIYVFGRHFQKGICHKIVCKIGDQSVKGYYVADHMIKCKVPAQKGTCEQVVVNISISFDDGVTFMNTNQTYKYF